VATPSGDNRESEKNEGGPVSRELDPPGVEMELARGRWVEGGTPVTPSGDNGEAEKSYG